MLTEIGINNARTFNYLHDFRINDGIYYRSIKHKEIIVSADNQLVIIKKIGKPFDKYLAYDICASCEEDYKKQFKTSKIKWEAYSLDEAVRLAEKYTRENEVEYGYSFLDY